MKTTEGCKTRAIAKRARTSFSPSPTHFDVMEDAAILKNVALHCDATHRPAKICTIYKNLWKIFHLNF